MTRELPGFFCVRGVVIIQIIHKNAKVFVLVIFLILFSGCSASPGDADRNENTVSNPDTGYKVVRVVDGDTLVIDYQGKEERVRLIGVDTPETKHPQKGVEPFGKEASDYTKNLLEGKKVILEWDVQERDRYGRLLAYVYYDGKMVNEALVSEGYARIMTIPPNVKYADRFLQLEQQAREENRGLWGLNPDTAQESTGEKTGEKAGKSHSSRYFVANMNSRVFHLPDCSAVARMNPANQKKVESRDELLKANYKPCSLCNP